MRLFIIPRHLCRHKGGIRPDSAARAGYGVIALVIGIVLDDGSLPISA
jgi:hypothetical protein